MKRFAVGVAAASLAFVFVPRMAAAQCEGGVTVAGHYTPEGAYVPGGCAYTNPTTPGQLYPSGAQPAPSTNPAQGGSRLPGQDQPSDLIPVNSSDLGPAPSLVSNYEQLELCLSGAFSTCPRFGGGQNGPATPAPAGETPPPQLVDEPTRLGAPRPPLGERTLLRRPTRQAPEERTLLAGRRRPLVLIVGGAFGVLLLAGWAALALAALV